MHLFDYYSIDKRWAYPLRALNLFEIVYWFVLVEGIHHYARKDKKYVWIIVVFFLRSDFLFMVVILCDRIQVMTVILAIRL